MKHASLAAFLFAFCSFFLFSPLAPHTASAARLQQAPVMVSQNTSKFGKLVINTTPENAEILFLDKDVTYREGMLLPEGAYRAQIRTFGYEPRIVDIVILAGQRNVMHIDLTDEPWKNLGEKDKDASPSYSLDQEGNAPAKQAPIPPDVQPYTPGDDTPPQQQTTADDPFGLGQDSDQASSNDDVSSPDEQAEAPAEPSPTTPRDYIEMGQYDKALEELNTIIFDNPKNVDALKDRGLALYYLGKYEEAVADHNATIALAPKDPMPYFDRANVYLSTGDYDLALEDYNAAIALAPNYADFYNARGVAQYHLGSYNAALADYTYALQIDPEYKDALFNRAVTFHKSKKYQMAVDDYNRLLELDPKNTSVKKRRSKALQALGM